MAAITINSFLEDTSVLVAGAYLFVRGPMERLIKHGAWLGVLAGAFAASEAIFPGDRYPYAPHTLACAFATIIAGPVAGIIAAAVAIASAYALNPNGAASIVTIQVLFAVASVSGVRKLDRSRIWCVPAAALGQLLGTTVAPMISTQAPMSLTSPITVASNAFGFTLLLLVVRDAKLREDSYTHMHEVDEARRISAEAKLAIVRTRVQPHFLFNALNTIAALCTVSPERASAATLQLGKLMRRSLEIDFGNALPLADELETVKSYLVVEKERFGSKLSVSYDIENVQDIKVPAFSVQILVENAVLHGITPKASAGAICVIAKRRGSRTTLAVIDDGVGFTRRVDPPESVHGLTILKEQLHVICGPTARLHVVNRPGGGTIAVFRIPAANGLPLRATPK